MTSIQNLHIDSKTYIFLNTFKSFHPKRIFCWMFEKYWRAFTVYMFRGPPAVFNLVSDNALISGFGKVPIVDFLIVVRSGTESWHRLIMETADQLIDPE